VTPDVESGPVGLGEALVERLPDAAGAVASVSGGDEWARATVDVESTAWVAALVVARSELACDFFDWLGAVDEQESGFTVVTHVWSTTARHGLLVRTRVSRSTPALATLVDVYPGAAWHEREAHEMFGIDFSGHPDLVALLLPDGFEGHPLRKDFVLAARVVKPWPGTVEPGERRTPASQASPGERRAPLRPPGVPAPGEWGPPDD
jgi:NADH-quinone oxidoreductase subunit C